MIIQIEVMSVKETNMGKYKKLEVAFRQDGKVQGKNLVSYHHPDVYDQARNFTAGQVVSIEIGKEADAKSGREFWHWQRVVGAEGVVESAEEPKHSPEKTQKVSNYETREERLVRQQYIIRQSSLGTAVEFLTQAGGKGTVAKTEEDVIALAEKFVEWVNNVEGK